MHPNMVAYWYDCLGAGGVPACALTQFLRLDGALSLGSMVRALDPSAYYAMTAFASGLDALPLSRATASTSPRNGNEVGARIKVWGVSDASCHDNAYGSRAFFSDATIDAYPTLTWHLSYTIDIPDDQGCASALWALMVLVDETDDRLLHHASGFVRDEHSLYMSRDVIVPARSKLAVLAIGSPISLGGGLTSDPVCTMLRIEDGCGRPYDA